MNLARFSSSFILIILVAAFSLSVSAQGLGRGKTASYSVTNGRSGVLFDVATYYGQSEATANPTPGNEWSNITSIYDIKLGYVTDSQIYFGAGYSVRTDSTTIADTTGSGGTPEVGLGYMWGSGWHLRSFYRINEFWGNYNNGTGFQADFGYMVNMSSSFHLGLLVSHRQTTFTSNSLIAGFRNWIRKETVPMVTLGFLIN